MKPEASRPAPRGLVDRLRAAQAGMPMSRAADIDAAIERIASLEAALAARERAALDVALELEELAGEGGGSPFAILAVRLRGGSDGE